MDLRVLNIYLGDMKDAIYHPPTYFDNQYEDEWLTDKTAIQMIRDVDHSEVISARLIDSPVLGPISPKELSGGVKTLILIAYDTGNKVFNASACGDNCAQWLLRLGEQKEVTINLSSSRSNRPVSPSPPCRSAANRPAGSAANPARPC